jgi:hypothetical protein
LEDFAASTLKMDLRNVGILPQHYTVSSEKTSNLHSSESLKSLTFPILITSIVIFISLDIYVLNTSS